MLGSLMTDLEGFFVPGMGWREMSKTLYLIVVFCLMGFGLSACGVKGSLELPPEVKKAEAATGPDGKKLHKPFILDGLIQ